MKIKVIILGIILTSTLAFSQSSSNKNIVKTNLTAYAFRNVNLTYERIITKKFSMSATYATMPEGTVPYINTFLTGEDLGDIKNAKVSSSAITLEPRFYLNKNGFGSGFYLGPYYRNTSINVKDYKYYFTPSGSTKEEQVNVSGKIGANSFGILLGNQWLLGASNNWVIDFTIFGGHYGFSKGDLDAVASRPLTQQEQKDLQDELNKLDLPMVKINATANANGAKAKLDGPWAGVRFALSLGYKF